MLGNKSIEATENISGALIKERNEEKLLGVTIVKKLNFKSHVNSLCKKASQKLHALARISTYMEKKLPLLPASASEFQNISSYTSSSLLPVIILLSV